MATTMRTDLTYRSPRAPEYGPCIFCGREVEICRFENGHKGGTTGGVYICRHDCRKANEKGRE